MLRVVFTMLLGLTLLAGCDRRVESFDPDEKPEQPDLSRIFPPETAAPPTGTEAPSMPPAPPGQRRGAPPVAAANGPPIRGIVRLAPGLEDRARDGVLFVIARSPEGGPPLAVKRFQAPGFPLEFELGPEDRMVAARPFVGPLLLSARLDADGNATSRAPDEPQATAPAPVNPGDTDINLLLE